LKRSIWIFLLAVLLPSAVLGWLALRSVEEQQIILEKRTAELYQTQTENAASAARALIDDERRAFNETVRRLLATGNPQAVANNFSTALAKEWPRKAIGFALGKEGQICSPPPQRAAANKEWGKFLLDNGSWMAGTTPATVYWVAPEDLNRPEQRRRGKGDYGEQQSLTGNVPTSKGGGSWAAGRAQSREQEKRAVPQQAPTAMPAPKMESPSAPAAAPGKQALDENFAQYQAGDSKRKESAGGKDLPQDASALAQSAQIEKEPAVKLEVAVRNVEPQQVFANANPAFSQLTSTNSDFQALTSDANEGVITRFVQDRLNIIFWLRPAQAPEMIFGCLIEADNLRDLWPAALPVPERGSREKWSRTEQPEFVLALLDDKARPVATQPPGETGRDWKRPFVASEIGEALPHWELALYLQRPEQLRESARALRRTLSFLIVAALGAIACGGWLVVADARRQLARAQQKTDFVSNVSHELKTPLTSIRMFAELMQNGNGNTAKHPQYLRIIMVEAERLTRLINNVLDFAGLERKQKRIERKPLDLHAVIGRAWEGHALHLQESGFSTRWEAAPPPYPVVGDDDALAQILVNLLSNAEKYSGERKEVELHTYLDGEHVCVSVLDRGCGVPGSEERKIFEAFYRAHDSLSSGIQGSGLGLTLAQRLAHEHGGEITYQPRAGGGSNFTLRLPIVRET
jgi:signal transduction histidine kinase